MPPPTIHPAVRRAAVLAVTALAVRLAWQAWYYSANLGFPQTFGDCAYNLLEAAEAARRPLFSWPDVTLPPLNIWLMGLALRAGKMAAATALQASISAVGVALVWGIARELFPGKPEAAGAASASAALHPVGALLGVGGLQVPLTSTLVLGGTWSWLVYRRRETPAPYFGACACFAAATASHYDGWPFALVFSALLAVDAARNGERRRAAAGLLLVWCFAAAWAWRHVRLDAAPPFLAETLAFDAADPRLAFAPLAEWSLRFPAVLALSALALARSSANERRRLALHAALPAGQAVLLGTAYLLGGSTPFCHYTHVWTGQLLALPLAAAGALSLLPAARQRLLWLWLFGYMLFGVFRFPGEARALTNFSADAVRLTALLQGLRAGNVLSGGERVLLELHEDDSSGRLWELQMPFLAAPGRSAPYGRTWDPPEPEDSVLLDRKWDYRLRGRPGITKEGNPSLFAREGRELADLLARDRVTVAVAHSHGAAERLGRLMPEAGRLGPYRIFAGEGPPREAAEAAARALAGRALPWRK